MNVETCTQRKPQVKRALKQRSCDACRLRKIACSLRAESSKRQSLKDNPAFAFSTSVDSSVCGDRDRPACRACKGKGIKCVISNEEVPFRRNRTGKNIEKAQALAISKKSESPYAVDEAYIITPSTEQSLHLVAISGRLGHLLIAVCADRPQQTLDCPPLCIPLFDQWSMQERFEAAGGRLDQMCTTDRLLCSIMLALGVRMISDTHLGSSSRGEAFYTFSQRAVKLVDENGTWRKCDPENIAVMIMMSQLLCDGNIGSVHGRRYRRAALVNLDEFDYASRIPVEDRNNGYNDYLALLIIDSACALEAGKTSLMSQSLIAKFSRCKGLPQPDLLLRLANEHRVSCIGLINGVSLEYGGLLMWSTADYCASLYATSRMQDNVVYHNIRAQLDSFEIWLLTVKQTLPEDVDISLYLDMIWCTRLLVEMRLLRALESVVASMSIQGTSGDEALFTTALQACTISRQRFQSSLMSFVIKTAFNKNKINALALLTGTAWSVEEFKVFNKCFVDACQGGFTGALAPNEDTSRCFDWMLKADEKVGQAYSKGGTLTSIERSIWSASSVTSASGSPSTTLSSGSTSVCSIGAASCFDHGVDSEPANADFALMDSWIDWLQVESHQ